MTYLGVITGRDPSTKEWITMFEDGTQDWTVDPANDADYMLLN